MTTRRELPPRYDAAAVERLAGRLDPRQGTSFVRVQLWQASITLVGESPLLAAFRRMPQDRSPRALRRPAGCRGPVAQ